MFEGFLVVIGNLVVGAFEAVLVGHKPFQTYGPPGVNLRRADPDLRAQTVALPVDPWSQLGDPRILSAPVALVMGLLFNLRAAGRPVVERME